MLQVLLDGDSRAILRRDLESCCFSMGGDSRLAMTYATVVEQYVLNWHGGRSVSIAISSDCDQ